MPHIGIIMERSLQDRSLGDAFVDLVSRSAAAALGKRQSIDSISHDINDAATAFSSWDNCFQAAICKWPVIALLILAGLIVLSVVWCVIRCCCCGLSCCCECCYCLKCCGECCGLCDPPRGKRSKYLDEPFVPPNHDQAYRSHAPMNAGFDSMKPTVPQYAEFDSGDKKDADALPAMPVWEQSSSKKVLIEEESVEMEPLKKPSPVQNSQMNRAATPSNVSPRAMSPYGPSTTMNNHNGYMAGGHDGSNPYGMDQQAYSGYDNRGYGEPYASNNMNSMAGVAVAGSMGRRTPQQEYNTGYDRNNTNQGYSQYPQSRSPRPYNDEYARSGTPTGYNHAYQDMAANNGYGHDRRSPAPQAGYGYGNPPRMGTPGAQAGYGYNGARRSPAPQADYGFPQRSRTQDDYAQPYSSPSTEEYSNNHEAFANSTPAQYARPTPPVSPIRNNSGFDFNSGYSRANSNRASPAPSPAPTPAPAQNANGGTAYPGYRAYKPAQDAPQQHAWEGL